jgi:hypothetical protein
VAPSRTTVDITGLASLTTASTWATTTTRSVEANPGKSDTGGVEGRGAGFLCAGPCDVGADVGVGRCVEEGRRDDTSVISVPRDTAGESISDALLLNTAITSEVGAEATLGPPESSVADAAPNVAVDSPDVFAMAPARVCKPCKGVLYNTQLLTAQRRAIRLITCVKLLMFGRRTVTPDVSSDGPCGPNPDSDCQAS